MIPHKPKTAITVGIGVAPKSRSPLPSTSKNPFADLLKGGADTGAGGGTDDASGMGGMAGQKEDVLGQTGAKASRDDAGFIAQGSWCGACSNYTAATKECSKVDGSFKVGDSCSQYFEALPGHENTDEEATLMAGLGDAGSSGGAGKPDETGSSLLG